MSIRTRLTLQFALIVACILLIAGSAIYYFSAAFRENQFHSRLYDKTQNLGSLFVKFESRNTEFFDIVSNNTVNFPEEKLWIINDKGSTIYFKGKKSHPLPPTIIKEIFDKGSLEFVLKGHEAYGAVIKKEESKSAIIISAYDKFGYSKLNFLKLILGLTWIFSIGITYIVGLFYAHQALKPISKVIEQVDAISASTLNARLDTGNSKDEISKLASTFNNMLERIESAFELQKNFVSNASHGLRTPLTAIMGQIDVTLLKGRTKEEYQSILTSISEDMRHLITISNALLDLAQANLDAADIHKDKIRIDELLWQAVTDLQRQYNKCKINFDYLQIPDDEDKLSIKGNEHLIKTALINLLDNACKFSEEKAVNLTLDTQPNKILITISDQGKGIPKDELKRIFEPFYRSTNAKPIKGHGLGLTLTEKIVKLHDGKIKFTSELNKGTSVEVILPIYRN